MALAGKNVNIAISTGTIIRAIALVLLLWLLYEVRQLVGVVLFSIVIASAIEPPTSWLVRRRIPRILSVIIVYLIALAVLGLLFYLVVPTLFREFADFAGVFPKSISDPFDLLVLEQALPKLPAVLSGLFVNVLEYLQGLLASIGAGLLRLTGALFANALSLALIVVLSFYLSVQDKGIEKFLRVITPVQHERYIVGLWNRTRGKIGAWLKGQLILGVIVGILVYLGLTILRVDYAFTFALLAAVFELIPIFGPILSAVPPVALALITSPTLAIYVIILYIAIQQLENHLIYPLVVTKVVGVPPIVSILALVIGGKIAGFFGVLLSIPLVTALMEVYNDVEKRKLEALKARDGQ